MMRGTPRALASEPPLETRRQLGAVQWKKGRGGGAAGGEAQGQHVGRALPLLAAGREAASCGGWMASSGHGTTGPPEQLAPMLPARAPGAACP